MGSDRELTSAQDQLRRWVRTLTKQNLAAASPLTPIDLVRSVVVAGASELGLEPELLSVRASPVPDIDVPPTGWADPWLPGLIYEQAVTVRDRQARGAWFTPRPVVEGLVRFTAEIVELPEFVVDPTCGGGAFLLAVLDHWHRQGVEPRTALRQVAGLDIDGGAVAACRWALQLWAGHHGLEIESDKLDVNQGDALTSSDGSRWQNRRLVIGNPPFASPLKKGAIPAGAARYRERHRNELGPYADLAAIHLHRAIATAGSGSPVVLVLPQSVLSSRDVADFRRRLDETSATVGLWAARESVFEAGVRACAPVVVVDRPQPAEIALAAGPAVSPRGTTGPARWAGYAARSLGSPPLPVSVRVPAARLGEICSATAGFRDEYYGLVDAVAEWQAEDKPPNRLVTVGSVDPLITSWGRTPLRFGGRKWLKPYVRTDELNDKIRRWCDRQAVPKLVVATQSRLLEPVLDPGGELVPSTPLLSVHAAPDDLAMAAAVLLAPPVVAVAWERWFGSALAVDALKLAAGQIGELPLPPNRAAWEEAAALIAAVASKPDALSSAGAAELTAEVASLMNRAYGAPPAVFDWWRDRVPGANAPVAPAGVR